MASPQGSLSQKTPLSSQELLQPECWTPPYPCAHTQLLINLPFHLLTSSLIHQLPSTGTTNCKVLTLQHIMPSTPARFLLPR